MTDFQPVQNAGICAAVFNSPFQHIPVIVALDHDGMQPLEGVGDKAGIRGKQQFFPGAAALDKEAQRFGCVVLCFPGKHCPEHLLLAVQVKGFICPNRMEGVGVLDILDPVAGTIGKIERDTSAGQLRRPLGVVHVLMGDETSSYPGKQLPVP